MISDWGLLVGTATAIGGMIAAASGQGTDVGWPAQLASFGISGLLFIMWWYERRDKATLVTSAETLKQMADRSLNLNNQLIQVIENNTAANVNVLSELRLAVAENRRWHIQSKE